MEEIPLMLSLLAGAGLSLGLAKAASLPRLLRERMATHGSSPTTPASGSRRSRTQGLPLPAARLPGAGMAMARPPTLRATVQELRRLSPTGRYRIPLGWGVDGDGR